MDKYPLLDDVVYEISPYLLFFDQKCQIIQHIGCVFFACEFGLQVLLYTLERNHYFIIFQKSIEA